MHTRYESSKVAKAAGLIRSGGVAQLVRVPPCHGGCCGFKSRLSRHYFTISKAASETTQYNRSIIAGE